MHDSEELFKMLILYLFWGKFNKLFVRMTFGYYYWNISFTPFAQEMNLKIFTHHYFENIPKLIKRKLRQ